MGGGTTAAKGLSGAGVATAIKPVSKAVSNNSDEASPVSAVKRLLGFGDEPNSSTETDPNTPQNTLKKFIENSSKIAGKAVTDFAGKNFGNSVPPYLAMAAQAGAGGATGALGQLADQLNRAWGGGGAGGTPGHYGGDPNNAPGLNGYHFGDLAPIQHTKPAGAEISDNLWTTLNNNLGRAFNNGDELYKAVKPYLEMGIPSAFKQDSFSLATLAMYKPDAELINSGKLDFLHKDNQGYGNFNDKFWQLISEAKIDRGEALNTISGFGGIKKLSNLDPRFVMQAVRDKDYLEKLPDHAAKLREQGNGADPKFTVVMHIVNDPDRDFNGVHNRNHGYRPGQLSAMKDYAPQAGEGSASNVIVAAVQGDNAQTNSENYTGFIGKQMEKSKADYNLVLNYDSHGSGYHADIGMGPDGSIDKSDAEYFRKIGYDNATASSIMLNFNSCHNGGLATVAAEYVAQGARARRQELGDSMPLKDLVVTGRSTDKEGWLMMDGATNYLPYWDKSGKLQTIHGSQQNDMKTHPITINGNNIAPEAKPESKPEAKSEQKTSQNENQNNSSKNTAQQATEPKKTEEELIAEKTKKPDLETQVA